MRATWTGRAEGDLGIHADGDVAARRRAVVDRPWCWTRQVHGRQVVTVGPGRVSTGREGDAIVYPMAGSRAAGRPGSAGAPGAAGDDPALAVFTADCAPIALSSPEGVMAAVHAGWRGLVAGVVAAAADVMRSVGARSVVGALGPCIHAECYEFGMAELSAVEEAVGGRVSATTSWGTPALDLPAAVARAAHAAGVELVHTSPVCTACSAGYFSHRARQDAERQALAVWRG